MEFKKHIFFLQVIGFCLLTVSFAEGQGLLIRHANILTMLQPEVEMDCDILIENGVIISVGRNISIPKNLRVKNVINLNGKWVMPGLIDMHVHLFDKSELI